MRVKWNRQLDGSLARRQAEEQQQKEEEEARKQQEGKDHKSKDSPKLFRLFRRKKRRAPVPPGALPGAPFAPSEADEDDCASISSVATVASQPTEVCQRDKTMSIFSSFRLNFPGSKKKSKRIVASAGDGDPAFHPGKEPSRYSSPDLRRERLDGPCGAQLSNSSPSVKDAVPSKGLHKENEDLIKHSSTNCFVKAAVGDFGGQAALSKSSPSVGNSSSEQCKDPFNLLKQPSVKQDVKMVRDKLGDSQIEMSKSTPSVKVSSSGFVEISNSFNDFKQYNNNCIYQGTKNTVTKLDTGLNEVSKSASIVEESVTDLHNEAFKEAIIIDSKFYNDQTNVPNSISFVKDTASCDLKSLERLRMENSNSLDQLKHGDAKRCAQKNMRSAKSVSFLESSLSPRSDVTSVAEAGVFPTVNAPIEEAFQRKSLAHSAEPCSRGKLTSDDSAEPFHAVSGSNRIEKAAWFGAPDKSVNCGERNTAPCDANMQNGYFHNGVCSEDLKLKSTSAMCNSEIYEDYCVKVCDQECVVSDSGAEISKSVIDNSDRRIGDCKLNSTTSVYLKGNFIGDCDGPVALGSISSNPMHNEITTKLETTLESMQTNYTTNLSITPIVINEDDVVQAKTCIELPVFENINDLSLNIVSKQIESPLKDANSFSTLSDGDVESCESAVTRKLSECINHNVETSTQDLSTDCNQILNVSSNVLPFNNDPVEIQSNNCDVDVMPKARLLPEYSECHNHSDLHTSNCYSDFSTNSYVTQEDINNLCKRSNSQCLHYSNEDCSNVSDSLVQLNLLYSDGLIFEHDIHATEIKKKSILHSKPSEIQLDFLRNNALPCVGSYLRKLTEAGTISEKYFDSKRQIKNVWNASLDQKIISLHFPTKGWLFDPSMDVRPPFVATIREKNTIIPERCPDLSSAAIPTTVTVAEHDLHTDTPGYFVGGGSEHPLEQDNTEVIPNVEKTSSGPFFDVQNVPADGDIYDHSLISLERCYDYTECDRVGLQKLHDCIKKDTESTLHSNEYVSEQKCSKNLLLSYSDTSVHLHENVHDTALDNCVPEGRQVDLSADGITSPEMALVVSNANEFIDTLPAGDNLSDIFTSKNGSCEYENESGSTKFKIDTWTETISKFSASEIGNNIDEADSKVAYEGVKNKIKLFESGPSDVSSDSTHSKITPSNKLEQSQKKNCERGKISMIPSLRKGIPTVMKNSHVKTFKGKGQIQKNKIKDPEKMCRKSSNESQHRLIKSKTDKNFLNNSQIETRLQSDRKSSTSSIKVHGKKLDSDQPNIVITKSNIKIEPNLSNTCITPVEFSPTPEVSERSKSEEFLLDSIPQSPVSNPNISFRRHSAAAVFETTTDFFHQNVTNLQTLKKSSEIELSDFKSSEKTPQIDSLDFKSCKKSSQVELLDSKSSKKSAQIELINSLNFKSSENSPRIDSLDFNSSGKPAQISPLDCNLSEESAQISPLDCNLSEESSQISPLDCNLSEKSAQISALDFNSSEETAQISPSHFKSSNLTLEEVSLSILEEDSSSSELPSKTTRSLQDRRSSLPLVIGQVQVPGARNNSAIKDARRASTRIPTKHAGGRGGSSGGGAHLSASKPVRPPLWLSKAELSQEIQRLGTLCEARTKELNRLKMETKHVTVGFDAFAALFKYMVEDVNGLSVPQLSEELGKTLKQLELAKQDLAYYEREVEEMKAHHCQELNDLSNKLFEVFQGEVTELGAKHQEEINRLNHEHELQLQATSETYKVGYEETQACHEAAVMKLQQELITQREELQLLHDRELQELELKHRESSRTLQEHSEQLQKKCQELKQHSIGMEDAMKKDTDSKLQWVTSRKGDLEKEVESLKAVLEMKNKELHTLRVQNLEMDKQLEELPLAREKIKMLSARAEDLEALMAEKTRLERKLSTENQVIRDTYEKESKVNRRLSMENEELQWRLRQAEQSIISGSFSEVPELAEESENCPISPMKSPLQMSRSVFFTFVDKDASSPRSQYKKITPGFSSGYKTSPSKSSAPSPRRARGLSEPMHPSASTPKKAATALNKQKRQRAGTAAVVDSAQSFAGSMVSSVGSESSVFDQGGELLEDHKEQILETLEILREQRCSEEVDGLEGNECLDAECGGEDVAEGNGECLVPDTNVVGVPEQSGKCLVLDGNEEQNGKDLVLDHIGDIPYEKDNEMAYPEELVKQIALGQNGECIAQVEKQSVNISHRSNCGGEPLKSGDSEMMQHNIQQQNGKVFVLGNGPESMEGLQQPASFIEEKICFPEAPNKNGSDPVTPVAFEGDDMSRSAEFSDPKTYYHMTFPVLKEAGAQDCDTEDNSPTAQATHSIVDSSKVICRTARSSKEVSSETVVLSSPENGALTVAEKTSQENALSQSCCSTENVQEQSREKNRWRTM